MTKRKCGNCGKKGHDSRNCPDKDEDRAWKDIQKTLKTPTCIHISVSGKGKLCGAKKEWWPEKNMTDEFAQTLPVCEDCKNKYEAEFERPFDRGV